MLLNQTFFYISFIVFLILPIFVIIGLTIFKIKAPYGRHTSNQWGNITISGKWGWIIMESPSSIIFLIALLMTPNPTLGQIALFIVWQFHYFYRSFIYPCISHHSKRMPIVLMIMALMFQLWNTYYQSLWVYKFAPEGMYGDAYITSWNFILGLVIFLIGSYINRQSDTILRNLRKSNDTGYKIPYGGLYHWISSPNYLGEIIIWLGWAVMLKSWIGFAFFFWTVANLAPRALEHHRWYLEKFSDYPKNRKALIPYIL